MSLKHKTLVGLFLALMSSIGSVVAATIPGTVDDVDMVLTQEGGVAVSWTGATDAAQYRVFFSRESILENEGNYDDFVETQGTETTYVFSSYPLSGGKMYTSVLAVSADGTESEGFVTEASIDLPELPVIASSEAMSEPSTAEPEPVTPTTTSEPLTIEAVAAQSLTGVLIRFSKPIVTDLSRNPFILTETGGALLRIVSAQILDDRSVLLTTEAQTPMKKYVLGLVLNVGALDGTSMTVSSPRILFDAFAPGSVYVRNPQLGSSSSAPSSVAPLFVGPTKVELQSMKRPDGTHTVTATWDTAPDITEYVFYTTTDGTTFTKVGTATATQTSARFQKVKAQNFGVKVTAKNAQGSESEGVTKFIALTSVQDKPLPNSGLPMLGVMLAAGALAGSRMKWKKK